MRHVYLDYGSATPLDARVKAAMEPWWDSNFANPSSIHRAGREAKAAIERARETVARVLRCRPSEIVFTASGTEADNLAIRGTTRPYQAKLGTRTKLSLVRGDPSGHVITTAIEHPAVLRVFETLERDGWAVTYLPVDGYGRVSPEALRRAIRPETLFVSIAYASGEIGTVQPLAEIGATIREIRRGRERDGNRAPLWLHTDASAAAGFLELNVEKLGTDLMTLNAAKMYGPKGVGALFVRRGIALAPLVHGGGQERGLRSGTENVPGIIGFAAALEIAEAERARESVRLAGLREELTRRLITEIPETFLNGHPTERLPNNVNVSILGVEAEAAVVYLDAQGIAASTGSACTPTSIEPSRSILAIGKPPADATSSLRFTLGRGTERADLDVLANVLPPIVRTLRAVPGARSEGARRRAVGVG